MAAVNMAEALDILIGAAGARKVVGLQGGPNESIEVANSS
jgi:hypothetical protein